MGADSVERIRVSPDGSPAIGRSGYRADVLELGNQGLGFISSVKEFERIAFDCMIFPTVQIDTRSTAL